MANHKRRRPKHQRNGCLLCKPYKDEREGGNYTAPINAQRKLQEGDDFDDPEGTYLDEQYYNNDDVWDHWCEGECPWCLDPYRECQGMCEHPEESGPLRVSLLDVLKIA